MELDLKPIPILFHLGPLQIHTYGIGLTLTFIFGYRYFSRRLRQHGYPTEWLNGVFLWIIAAAIVGARIVHVLANIGFYLKQPVQIPQIWHGGLSSFGGLGLAVPVGFLLARRRCPTLPLGVAADLLAPVLVAAWAVGRLLGPQLMFAGGGHPTTAWYGMEYAGQVGKRVPVPILQAIECAVIYLILLWLERRVAGRGGRPVGLVAAVAVALWDISRVSDEHFFLAYPGHAGAIAVQIGAGILAVAGIVAAVVLWMRDRHRPAEAHSLPPGQPGTTGEPVASTEGIPSSALDGAAGTSP